MGFLSALETRASIEDPKVSISDPGVLAVLFGDAFKSASGVTVTTESALGVPAVWAAVNFIANTIASLPLKIYRQSGERRDEAKNDPLYSLLHDVVNEDRLTSFKWRKLQMTTALTGGRAFTYIERNKAGRPMNLWPLDPATVEIRKVDNRTFYRVTEGKKVTTYEAGEILDIPFILASDEISHYAPVKSLKNALGLAIALESYASRFFQNGGVPPMALHGPMAGAGAVRRAKTAVEDAVKRANEENKNVLYLPEGHELKPLAFNPEQGQLTDARLFQLQEVARIYSMPPTFLQDLSHGTFCLPADAEVLTTDGPVRIADVRAGARVFSRKNDGGIVQSRVERVACAGEDPILSIRTSNRTIRLNARHRVLARRRHDRVLQPGEIGGRNVDGRKVRIEWRTEYVPAGELKVGDTIVAFNGAKDTGVYRCPTRPLSVEFMEFCGLLLGDGNVHAVDGKPSSVSIARAAQASYMNHYRGVMQREFHRGGYSADVRRCDGSGKLAASDISEIIGSSRERGELTRLARQHDVDPKTVRRVWESGNAAVAVRAFEEADIRLCEGARSTRFASTAAAQELTDLGLSGTAHTKRVPGWVYGVADQLKLAFLRGFLDADGSVDKKGRISFSSCNKAMLSGVRHLCMMLSIPVTNLYSRSGVTRLPNGKQQAFTQHYFTCSDPGANRRIGSHTEEYVRRMEAGTPFSAKKGRSYPRHGGRGFEESGCELSRIVSIKTEAGEPVYDLEVAGTHSFVADGVIVHNSNTEQQDLHFVKHTLTHWLKLWEQEFNAKLFGTGNRNRFAEFNVDGLLRGDFASRMVGAAQAVQNAIRTPNELRAKDNLPPIEGGDRLYIQGATVPLEMAGQQPDTGNPAGGGDDAGETNDESD